MPRNHHAIHRQRRQPLRLALVSLLVLALLWTQSLGLLHRLVHFDKTFPAKIGQMLASSADTSRTTTASGKLFSNHYADTDCQLFDQLSHADGATALLALGSAALVLPQYLRASHALAVARWHALFQARGPPSVR